MVDPLGVRPRIFTTPDQTLPPGAGAGSDDLKAKGGAVWGTAGGLGPASPPSDAFIATSAPPPAKAPGAKTTDPVKEQNLQFLMGMRTAVTSLAAHPLDVDANNRPCFGVKSEAMVRSLAANVLANKFIADEVKGAALVVLQREVPQSALLNVMGPLTSDRTLFDESGRLVPQKGKVTTVASTGPGAEVEFIRAQYQNVLGPWFK